MHGQPTSGQGDEGKASQLKEMIIDKAQKGVFNHNPLLNTTHFVICQRCKHKQSIVYLNSLTSGEFELGRAEQIDVLTSQGPIGFLEKQRVTPIIITTICEACDGRIEVRPVNAEYLQAIINRPRTASTMYA